MTAPRGLSDEEQAAWARLAQSVTPLVGRKAPPRTGEGDHAKHGGGAPAEMRKPPKALPIRNSPPTAALRRPPPRIGEDRTGLDSHWNRKLKAGQIAPDYTLDLHGHTLDGAYDRLMGGLDQARSMGARLVLVVAGRERPVDPADRATRRGAIRAKLLDWLAASRHGDAIAAVRRAHIRHGGDGALYLVLKRSR